MADRTVSIRFVASMGQYRASMAQAAASTNALRASTTGMAASSTTQMGKMGKSAGGLKTALGGISPMLIGAGGLAYGIKEVAGAAVGWESAFTGVKKTVEGTPAQLQAISDGLREMSTEIPTSAADLAGIAESAGQLGIETDNVLEFTRVIADLGETTNLSGEQGATELARFANITQMAQGDFDRLGSTIVDLGNNFQTTESEISTMALRIGAAGSQAGMTEADILGLSTAMSSVGIEAEAGGSAMSRTIIDISREVETGGELLERYAEIAGMSASAFSQAWEDDAAGALASFVSGLADVEASGGSVNGVLEELGITELRQSDAIRRLTGNHEGLTDALDTANGAWVDNNALQDEAAEKYATTQAKLDIAKNSVGLLAAEIGAELLPALKKGAEGLTDFLGHEFFEPGTGEKKSNIEAIATGVQFTPAFDLSSLQAPEMPDMGFGDDGTWQQIISIKPEVDWSRIEAGASVLDTLDVEVEESIGTWNRLVAPAPDWSRIEAGTGVLDDIAVKFEDSELAASDTGEAFRSATERLQDYLDTQRAATDPVFALNQAFQETIDTQTAYEESVQAIDDAERSLEGAHRDVEAAQRSQTEAVKEHGEGSQEAKDAAWALEEAQLAVGAADRGVTEAHEAVTAAAFAVAEAQADLEEKVLSGEVSWAEYEAKLQSWVDQGKITAEQAEVMRARTQELREEAEETEGTYEVAMEAETEAARDQVNDLRDDALAAEGDYRMKFNADVVAAKNRIRELRDLIGDIPANVTTRATVQYGQQGEAAIRLPGGGKFLLHEGGWVGRDEKAGSYGPLRPDEFAAVLKQDEYVVKPSQARRHAGLLEAINSGKMHEGGWAGMITGQTPGWMPGRSGDERMRVLQGGETALSARESGSTTVDNSRSASTSIVFNGPVDERAVLTVRSRLGAR